MTCNDYLAQHTVPLAQAVRHFLAREIPYQQLEDLSWQLLSHWQDLPHIPADKQPATDQEGVFWHLLHSLHQWDEQQIIADVWLRLQLMTCANYLITEGPCPRHCMGSRP
ncbi:hypothetical protein ACW5XW_11630 [Aeromonas piscicola]|uniref:Uncharacterized protein n=1 Tax=Aeromonas piscicola TaxID=600645 RepID=A0ABT7Q959_9GAMM|nr:hypothetical protein [Aeromonas piscicola]MCW0504580.1 hypothetical protein [Aeromonas piscicola]MDM5130485.1 hypothetical protein [Aeromonas piscicola]